MTVIDWILVNIPFILAIVMLIAFCVRAVKEGFVAELFGFISAIIASVAILLLALIVHGVFDSERIEIFVAIILILLLLIVHKMVVLLFEPLKLVVKLPILKVIDSIAGIAVAIVETVLIVWAIYCVVIIVGVEPVLDWIKRCTAANPVMKLLYDYNYLYALVYKIFGKISTIESWTLINMIRSI